MKLNPFYDGLNPDVEVTVSGINAGGDVIVVEASVILNEIDGYYAVGTARRDPLDPRDDEIGVKLAVGRAIRQIGRDILKDGQAGVREIDRARRAQEAASKRAAGIKAQRAKAAKKAAAKK